ncbi:hypothetical protein JXA40_04100 [bacterium]|nr:hypothetical protein [candidate division CSSED10-310 bacterium]
MTLTEFSRTHIRWLGLIAAFPLLGAAWMVDLPAKWGGFIGDSGVYYAMADSLARDSDLLYTRSDLVRITREWPGGPQGVLLAANESRPDLIHYAKPALYPLLTVPLVMLFKTNGMLIFNALCFLGILWVGFRSFPDASDRTTDAVVWTLVFWGLTAVTPYVFTLTPDLFNCAAVMAGLYPWLLWQRQPAENRKIGLLAASVAILGLAAAARPPNALFIILPLWPVAENAVSQIRSRRSKPALRNVAVMAALVLAFAAGAALVLWLNRDLTGQAFAYGGARKRIVGHFPFETPDFTFMNTGEEISTRSTQFVFHWSTLWLNLRYFLVGRFAGLIPYFLPAAVSCLLAVPLGTRRAESGTSNGRLSAGLLCGLLVLFHLVYIPSNYHGGSCAVGNRYLISYLPAFFLLLRRPPGRRLILAVAAVAALLSGPLALNPIDAMARYPDAGKRPVLNRFPPEITLLNSWPVDDLRHVRVPFQGYFAYFADDNQWGKELDGFWVKGDSRASLVLRCWEPVAAFQVHIANGGAPNRLHVRIGKDRFNFKAQPGERFQIDADPGPATLFFNLGFTDRPSRPSYCYPVSISTTDGFIPKFTEPGSEDPRFLGCFIQIGLSS